jgi:hypothetical protein
MLATSAESATPEIRKAKPVLSPSPKGLVAFPLSRVIGQPESAVNKVLGNPEKRAPSPYFPGGTYVSYPDGPTWKVLSTAFYRSKLTFIQFTFGDPQPMSEEEFFTALGLPKANFAVIKRLAGYFPATQYRGTINKHLIEIVAWRPPSGAFCGLVTFELVEERGGRILRAPGPGHEEDEPGHE